MQKLAHYKWPLLLFLVGIGLDIASIAFLFFGLRETGQDVKAPGETTVTITEPGDYTIWQETSGVTDGTYQTYSRDLPSGLTIRIVKQPAGPELSWRPDTSTTWSSINGKSRASVAVVTFPDRGDYHISVSGLPETRAFYLDKDRILRALFYMFSIGFLGMLLIFSGIGWGVAKLIYASKQNAPLPPPL
jgi:hypothetical protein